MDEIAQVVRRAAGGPQFLPQPDADSIAQGTADRCDLQRMDQPVAHMRVEGQWVSLGLLLQASEGPREDDPVAIRLEGVAVRLVVAGEKFLLRHAAGTQASRIQQRDPVQGATSLSPGRE